MRLTFGKTLLVFVLLTLGWTPAVSAQTPTPKVLVGQSFTVQMDHDGVNTTGYLLWICPGIVTQCSNTAQQQTDMTVRNAQGVVTFMTVPGLSTAGSYTMQAMAFNADGGTRSATLVFDVVPPPPSAPRNLRLVAVETTADGGTTLTLVDLADLRTILSLPPLQ